MNAQPDSGASAEPRRRVLIVIGALMLTMLLAALDQTIVSTALPTIVGDLGGLNHLSWVVTSYLLVLTVVTPSRPRPGRRRPRLRPRIGERRRPRAPRRHPRRPAPPRPGRARRGPPPAGPPATASTPPPAKASRALVAEGQPESPELDAVIARLAEEFGRTEELPLPRAGEPA